MNQQLVDQLSIHVGNLIKTKTDIQNVQSEGKKLRQVQQQEENKIETLMKQLQINECVSNDTCIKLSCCKRSPSSSFKNLLPLIQQVFKASPDQMNYFVQEVKRYKQSNCAQITKVVCRSQRKPRVVAQKFPKPLLDSKTSNTSNMHNTTPSLASALMSY